MSQNNKILQYIEKFKKYLAVQFENKDYLNQIILKHRTNSINHEYSCLYCKEIINILVLTQQFNCLIKPLNQTQLKHFNYQLPNQKNDIFILSILSEESTTHMHTHLQHIFMTTIDLVNQSFSIEKGYTSIEMNQFDPILSKSKNHHNFYSYVESDNKLTLNKQLILKKIDDDNLQSLPSYVTELYNDRLLKINREAIKEEINKMFPFLHPTCVNFFSKSNRNLIHFLYFRTFIADSFTQLISEAFNYQDYTHLRSIFIRIIEQDIRQLGTYQTLEEQYASFCELTRQKKKGLKYDELIDLVMRLIQKQNQKQDQNYTVELDIFFDEIREKYNDNHSGEDWN